MHDDDEDAALRKILTLIFLTAGLIGLMMLGCMGMSRAQQGPQPATYYRQNGPVPVRIYDGGTQARNAYDARRNLGVPSKDGIDSLAGNWRMTGSLTLPWTYATDNAFTIRNSSDTTKQFRVTLANQTTGTTSVDSLPAGSQMLAGLAAANVFRTAQSIRPATDVVGLHITTPSGATANQMEIYDTDGAGNVFEILTGGRNRVIDIALMGTPGNSNHLLIQNKSSVSATRTYSIDNSISSTDFMMTGGTQTVAGAKTFTGSSVLRTATASGVAFADPATTTKTMRFDLTGISASTQRTLTVPDANGTIALTSQLPATAGTSVYDPLLRVKDSELTVKNSSDTTKKAQFNLSQLTTGTTVVDTLAAIGGRVPVVVGRYDATGKTASISATTLLASAPVGMYRFEVTIVDETNGGGTVSVTPVVSGLDIYGVPLWDNIGSPTKFTIDATLAGDASQFGGQLPIYLTSSQDITFTTTVSGTVQYGIHIRLTFLP